MRYLVAIALLLCLGAGVIVLNERQEAADIQDAQAAARFANIGPRLTYPDDRLPVLELPDGQRRKIKSLLNSTRPMHFGDFLWNDAGVPPGRAWVRIDLAHQTLSLFRGGHEIGSTVILYGTDGKPTPLGVFHVLEKAVEHRSSLYDAEMPFMLRLTGDGVAIHASKVLEGSATHGCIGVPIEFARLLFAQIKRGDPVAILSGRSVVQTGRKPGIFS